MLDIINAGRDTFDPEGRFRDEDGDLRGVVEVNASLTRICRAELATETIIHDETQVLDISQLALQASIFGARLAFVSQILDQTVSLLIGCGRNEAAKGLIASFKNDLPRLGLDELNNEPIESRIGELETTHTSYKDLSRVLVFGHELAHLLVHTSELQLDRDEEHFCDEVALDFALTIYEGIFRTRLVGDELDINAGIAAALTNFEYFASSLFYSNSLQDRGRHLNELHQSRKQDVFAASELRYTNAVRRFRSGIGGELQFWPPGRSATKEELLAAIDEYFNLAKIDARAKMTPEEKAKGKASERAARLEQGPYVPHVTKLKQAFRDVNALIDQTYERDRDALSRVTIATKDSILCADAFEFSKEIADILEAHGIVRSLYGILIPNRPDDPGYCRWIAEVQRHIGPRVEPQRYQGPLRPGRDLMYDSRGSRMSALFGDQKPRESENND